MISDITYLSPFTIEETESKDYLVLNTCFLSEGMTGNGHMYTFSEMKRIVKQLIGKNVFFGATKKGKHIKDEKHTIGEVISAFLDTAKRKIYGKIKIYNTKTFPNLINTVRSYGRGMGISIGGAGGLVPLLKNGLPVLIKTGHGFLSKVVNMIVKHVQLIPPNVPRGQQEAQVLGVEETLYKIELVPIQETLIVNPEVKVEIEITYPKGSLISIEEE